MPRAQAHACKRCHGRAHADVPELPRPSPLQPEDGDAAEARAQPPEAFNGSALEWVLRKADESLDEIEENPPQYARVLYDISTGPIGAPCLWSGRGRRPQCTGRGCSNCIAIARRCPLKPPPLPLRMRPQARRHPQQSPPRPR